MSDNDKKIWLDLYKVAGELYELEPWRDLWDSYLFAYKDKEGNVYYCVMGKSGMHKGINVYKNDEIFSYLEMSNNSYPDYLMINFQDCMSIE